MLKVFRQALRKLESRLMTPKMAKAKLLAHIEMTKWGLDSPAWVFEFNNRKKTMGVCQYPSVERGRPGKIMLSKHFVEHNAESEVLDTIRHEIAHALAGRGTGHGPEWKRQCLLVGAKPERCGEAEMPAGKWSATCGGCQRVYHKHKAPRLGSKYSCPKCGRKNGQLTFRSNK